MARTGTLWRTPDAHADMEVDISSSAVREIKHETAKPKEDAVALLWRNAPALSEGLVTEDGTRLRVLYPGRANGGAGPDFRDCVLKTESGDLIRGDIELHVDSPDWYRHRHHLDSNYNGVVLHVVLFTRGQKRILHHSGVKAPVVALRPASGTSTPTKAWPTGLLPFRSIIQKIGLGQLLDEAGDRRFLSKSTGFVFELESSDPDEALYRAMMEALGYTANRKPFRHLATYVRFKMLRVLRTEPASTRLLAMKALLLNAAGLLSLVGQQAQVARLNGVLRHLPTTPRMPLDSWRLYSGRPANHPVRRIIGAAHLIDRYLEMGPVRGLQIEVERGDAALLARQLTVRPFIGTGRAREMAASVVLPFLMAWASLRREQDLNHTCVEFYHELPRLNDNAVTREMKRVLSPEIETVKVDTARRHQGLVYLYKIMTGRIQSCESGPYSSYAKRSEKGNAGPCDAL